MSSGISRADGGHAAVSPLEPRGDGAHSPPTVEIVTAPADSAGRARQEEIYLSGVRGARPAVPVSFPALEARAREAMSPQAFAYVAGGAGLESTMSANRAAFERLRIVPRVLRDVSARDTSVEVFSRRLASPLLLAPIGVLEMAHRQADLAVARAAAAEGVPLIFSNQASVAMEECAAAMGDAPRWFQLYWSSSDELVASLVRRAEACGCEAIVVTLDTTLFGWRPRDLDLAFLPIAFAQGIAQYTRDPVFRRLVEERRARGAEPTGEMPVLFDSGIRCGADVFKALALGARAVLIGRPYVYGLALAGEEGTRQVISNLRADFDLTMGLAGCRSVAEIREAPLRRAD